MNWQFLEGWEPTENMNCIIKISCGQSPHTLPIIITDDKKLNEKWKYLPVNDFNFLTSVMESEWDKNFF